MRILEQEQQRRVAGGPAEQRDDRLEQPRALKVRRDRRVRRGAAREVHGELGSQRRQIIWPGGVGRWRGKRRQQLADQLGPQAQRGRSAKIKRRARRSLSASCARPRAQLGRQSRLSDPRFTADHRCRSRACGDGVPRALELAQLAIAAEQRQQPRNR